MRKRPENLFKGGVMHVVVDTLRARAPAAVPTAKLLGLIGTRGYDSTHGAIGQALLRAQKRGLIENVARGFWRFKCDEPFVLPAAVETKPRRKHGEAKTLVLAVLSEHPDGISTRALREGCSARGGFISKWSVGNILRSLEEAGQAAWLRTGFWKPKAQKGAA